jgi:hypothetical protein
MTLLVLGHHSPFGVLISLVRCRRQYRHPLHEPRWRWAQLPVVHQVTTAASWVVIPDIKAERPAKLNLLVWITSSIRPFTRRLPAVDASVLARTAPRPGQLVVDPVVGVVATQCTLLSSVGDGGEATSTGGTFQQGNLTKSGSHLDISGLQAKDDHGVLLLCQLSYSLLTLLNASRADRTRTGDSHLNWVSHGSTACSRRM